MTSSSTQFALAVYDYEPELPDELELKVGDEIKIIESELTFEGWMRGEVNGNVGIFPDNFVELKPKEELQGQAIVVNKEKEDSKPQINQPIKDPPKRTKQVVMPHVVNILHDDKLKNELAGKLSKLTPVGPPPPPKAANKPPPPVPVNKPMLPSTKPKPQVPQSKPQPKLPFLSKVDNNISASPPPHNFLKDEMKTPVKPESKKMVIAPKSDEKSSVDESVEKKKLMPVIDLTLSNESKNNEQDLISLGRCASASVKEKPKVESPVVRSQSLTGQDEAPEYSKNSASIEHEMDEMANNHSKLSGKKSVQLDDIKPTDSLKHLERVKPPSKSPPSKFMDKHSSDEGSMSFDDGKEVDELKSQVRILENKMEDMAEMFKKLVIQLTDDLSTERKLRSNLQIDVETLNKKLNVFLDKPGL